MTSRQTTLVLVTAAWLIMTGVPRLYFILREDVPFSYKIFDLLITGISLVLGFALARAGRAAREQAQRAEAASGSRAGSRRPGSRPGGRTTPPGSTPPGPGRTTPPGSRRSGGS